MIVDPSTDEEAVMEARITLTTVDSGGLCAGQKGLPGGLTLEQVKYAAETSRIKGQEIREIIKKAVQDGRASS